MTDQPLSSAQLSSARRHQQGFTLVEIGVVLVIIGLLLAAVLKGQELIASARVNNLISTMNGYKAAINGFQDRYRIVQSDSSQAATIVGNGAISCMNSCNDGLINSWDAPGIVNNNLSAAGFYSGPVPTTTWEQNDKLREASSQGGGFLTNPGGGPIYVLHTQEYDDQYNRVPLAMGIHTGWNLSSKFLAEVDRKTDDGNALNGKMRNSKWGTTDFRNCWLGSGVWGAWVETNPPTNCGAVELLN